MFLSEMANNWICLLSCPPPFTIGDPQAALVAQIGKRLQISLVYDIVLSTDYGRFNDFCFEDTIAATLMNTFWN